MLLYNNKAIPKLTDNYLLSITDRAGNENHISVTIHVHNFVDRVCSICGEEIAPANELEKWEYVLDETNKKVTLNKYIGTDENVTIYSNYDVNGECYKTKLKDTVNNINIFTYNKTVKNIAFQKKIDTSNVTDMSWMFCGCTSLTSVDISNLDTSNVKNMSNMFSSNLPGAVLPLIELDVSNLDTRNVENMNDMFYGCENLTLLDLSNFDTSNVKNMNWMFNNCKSLTSIIGLDNFDTSNVIYMEGMFNNCSTLTSLDVSHFDTSNVINMEGMFSGCSSLTLLDLSNFDTSNVEAMSSIFYGCRTLTVIYVSRTKWIIKDGCNASYMFINCGVSEVTFKDAT